MFQLFNVTKSDKQYSLWICRDFGALEKALKLLKYELHKHTRFECTKRPGKFVIKGALSVTVISAYA